MTTSPKNIEQEERVINIIHKTRFNSLKKYTPPNLQLTLNVEAQLKQAILQLLSEAETRGRIGEIILITKEVGINKPRNKAVRQVYLKISYLNNRLKELTASLTHSTEEPE